MMGRFPKAFRNADKVLGRRLRYQLGMSMPVPDKHKTSPLALVDLGLLEFSIRAIAQPGATVACSGAGGVCDVDLISRNSRKKLAACFMVPSFGLAVRQDVLYHSTAEYESLARCCDGVLNHWSRPLPLT